MALPRRDRPWVAALYLRAELHRVRGEFATAEASYGEANEIGREPQPGLALMRLAQGQPMRPTPRSAGRSTAPATRSRAGRLLAPYVEICLAASDVAAARIAADELSAIAAELNADFLRAASSYCEGAVLLAEGDARGAVGRAAATHGRRGGSSTRPTKSARVRVAYRSGVPSVGDDDSAKMELDAAWSAFSNSGLVPDLARAEELSGTRAHCRGADDTCEVEVLTFVATGKTNRAIADDALHQREDGGASREQHLHETRTCRRGRPPPRTRTSTTSSERPTQKYPSPRRADLHDSSDATRPASSVPSSSPKQGGRRCQENKHRYRAPAHPGRLRRRQGRRRR